MTVAKVILHGAFLARVSVCAVPVCAPTPGNASPTYLPSTHSRSPQSLGASEKAAKAPAESRGKPVEGAAAAPKSHRRGLRIQIPLPPSGIPAAPSIQQQQLVEWSWCDAAQWVHCSSQQRRSSGERVKRGSEGERRTEELEKREHECAWIQPEGCRHALKGDHIDCWCKTNIALTTFTIF